MTAIVKIVNYEEFSQIYAIAISGELAYDIVDETPPGDTISDPLAQTDEAQKYLIDETVQMFHIPDCDFAEAMNVRHDQMFYGYRNDLLAQGYVPCGYCRP